jgi:hypothetical protein
MTLRDLAYRCFVLFAVFGLPLFVGEILREFGTPYWICTAVMVVLCFIGVEAMNKPPPPRPPSDDDLWDRLPH